MEALPTFGVTGESETKIATLEKTTKKWYKSWTLNVGIIADLIKHNVSLTVHEAKYIDLGWTGITKSIKQEWP